MWVELPVGCLGQGMRRHDKSPSGYEGPAIWLSSNKSFSRSSIAKAPLSNYPLNPEESHDLSRCSAQDFRIQYDPLHMVRATPAWSGDDASKVVAFVGGLCAASGSGPRIYFGSLRFKIACEHDR